MNDVTDLTGQPALPAFMRDPSAFDADTARIVAEYPFLATEKFWASFRRVEAAIEKHWANMTVD